MKSIISSFICFLLLLNCFATGTDKGSDKSKLSQNAPVSLYCSPDLHRLVAEWAKDYNNLNPGMKTDVNVITNPQSKLKTGDDLVFIQGSELKGTEAGWKMAVGREVTVPIVNSGNPFLGELSEKGISKETIAQLFMGSEMPDWGKITGNGKSLPVQLYVSNDQAVIASLKKYLEMNTLPDIGLVSGDEAKITAAVQNDPYAIGFCKLASVMDIQNQKLAGNIQLMPIDKNGNGRLDNMEKIYGNAEEFSRGVWIGKYPNALSDDIYVASAAQPASENQIAFLKWIIAGGQQSLASNGYSNLVYSEVQSKLDDFNIIKVTPSAASEGYSVQKLVFILAIIFILISLAVGIIIRYAGGKGVAEELSPDLRLGFDFNSADTPKGLYYDKTHTWAFMEKDGTVRIGLDDFLQHVTGPVTRVEMKKPGEKIRKGDILASVIQKGKQLDLYAPVSGTVQEYNRMLATDPSLLHSSPYADGWVYRIDPADWPGEVRLLSVAGKYTKWLADEVTRLKDFFAVTFQSHKLEYSAIVLQDGGTLKDNLLADYGPEVWEDFQTNFLDVNK